MNITIIGAGYVGLVTGACFAELGMNVLCMDVDKQKVKKLEKGIIPIYEPGLDELIQKNTPDRLIFTTNLNEAVQFSDVIFIAVNTPTLENNISDLSHVFKAAEEIALCMKGYKVIVNKSTVPVFTGQRVKAIIKGILQEQGKDIPFDVVSNPEFLQEGSAVNNFLQPDRIVIGFESIHALDVMRNIYSSQILRGVPLVATNIETSEMIKYASNAFLATKISFINEISNLCEGCGADVSVVAYAMGLDDRIGAKFLKSGPGYGGSCLPKDTKALLGIGKNIGYSPRLIKSVIEVNTAQKKLACKKIKNAVKRLKKRTITLLGLSFKPETDDIRESPAIDIIKYLVNSKAMVKVFDPKASENMKKLYSEFQIEYCSDPYSACDKSDCIVLVTEWKDFMELDFRRLKQIVRTPVFIDLRNVYEPDHIKKSGFQYEGIGRR